MMVSKSLTFSDISMATQTTSDLTSIVNALSEHQLEPADRTTGRNPLMIPHPSRDEINEIVEALRTILFPGYFGVSEVTAQNVKYYVGAALDRVRLKLHEQITRGLCFDGQNTQISPECRGKSNELVNAFIARLPEIKRLLITDINAAYEGDPAAHSRHEAIFCYPGVQAITNYRIAHELHRLKIPLIPRMIAECAHSATGIDIHPGAEIGESFFIDHGTGVVIGETSIIGNRVRIYQGVTLGAKSFPLDENGKPIKGIPRHPTVEDDVIIYSGATILGRITIGKGSAIGGNVWLTQSVQPYSRVTQGPSKHTFFESGSGI